MPGLALDALYGAAVAQRWGYLSGPWGSAFTVGIQVLLPGDLGGWGWGDFVTIGKSPISKPSKPGRKAR